MIPAFQGFLLGGGVNPYVSRVATFCMRENLVPHVARLDQAADGTKIERLKEAAVKSGIQFTWAPAFYANGGGEEFIRLAYSWEPPERNYEGAKLIAQALDGAFTDA
jgi:DNA-binding transcriptional MocR family regulator